MQPSSRALKPIRNLYHDANIRSSYCLRIAGILRRKLTACWPTIPNACSLTVCAPHSSYALMRSLRDHHLLRPPSKRRARTCTIPRAVTQPLRVLGSRAVPLVVEFAANGSAAARIHAMYAFGLGRTASTVAPRISARRSSSTHDIRAPFTSSHM